MQPQQQSSTPTEPATTVSSARDEAPAAKRYWKMVEPNNSLISARYLFVNKAAYLNLESQKKNSYYNPMIGKLKKKCERMDNALLTEDNYCSNAINNLLYYRGLNKENEIWSAPSIRNYLENTFKRLVEQGKLLGGFVAEEGKEPELRVIIWHTGLQTIHLEEIFCVITRNPRFKKEVTATATATNSLSEVEESSVAEESDEEAEVQSTSSNSEYSFVREFELASFLTGAEIVAQYSNKLQYTISEVWLKKERSALTPEEKQLLEDAKDDVSSMLPTQASYFATSPPEQIVFCPELKVDLETVNVTHLIDNRRRLPKKYHEMSPLTLSHMITAAARHASLRAKSNPRLAIPQLYKAKGIMESSMQLLLPINIADPTASEPDAALVLRVNNRPTKHYEIVTVLDLEKAYGNARVVCKIDQDWLRHIVRGKTVKNEESEQHQQSSTTTAPSTEPVRYGVVKSDKTKHGYIRDLDGSNNSYYFKFSHEGRRPVVGDRVTFSLVKNPQRDCFDAVDVKVDTAPAKIGVYPTSSATQERETAPVSAATTTATTVPPREKKTTAVVTQATVEAAPLTTSATTISAPPQARTGKVYEIRPGCGFIKEIDTENVHFYHLSRVNGTWPNIGDIVSFTLEFDPERKQTNAVNVTVTSSPRPSPGGSFRGRGTGRGMGGFRGRGQYYH